MDHHGPRIKRILGVRDGRVFPTNRASSSAPNESARSSATSRGLLYLLVSLEFERFLDAAIAVRQWSVRLEEMCDLFRNRHAIIVPSRKSKSPSAIFTGFTSCRKRRFMKSRRQRPSFPTYWLCSGSSWPLPINPFQNKRRLIHSLVHEKLLREIRLVRIHDLNHLPGAKQSGSKQNRVLTFFGHWGLVDWCAEEGENSLLPFRQMMCVGGGGVIVRATKLHFCYRPVYLNCNVRATESGTPGAEHRDTLIIVALRASCRD
jgi:hypothetical protein